MVVSVMVICSSVFLKTSLLVRYLKVTVVNTTV